ncbi:hypothetical protein BV20DRAFT_960657 [Pilatotrama ljubarskyi]|nr:hypothetical protein BV20DRAFT_960657 [Pilatotrama ljubarskyi]
MRINLMQTLLQRRIRRSIAPALPSAKAYPSLRVAAPHGCPSSPAVLTRPAISREFRPTGAPELLPHADTSLDYDGIITRRHNIPRTTVPATPTYTVPVKDHTPSASRVLQKMTSTSVHLSRPPPGYSRKFRDHQIDSVFLTEGTAALGQREREKCYDTLSRVLGPADGIQECVGTYKAYMARQLEIYYEDFLPGTPAPVSEVSYGTNSLLSPMGQSQATHVASQQGSVSSQAPQEDDGPHLWDALTAILDFPSCSSASQVLPGCASMTVDSTSVGAVGFESLGGTLANPAPPERERPRTVTFAAAKGMPPSSGFNPRPYLPFFDSSSSSLAGALGETALVQDAPRKAKEWVRPQMGRARAYSAGGGM